MDSIAHKDETDTTKGIKDDYKKLNTVDAAGSTMKQVKLFENKKASVVRISPQRNLSKTLDNK
jgi:hypothetical protein